MAYFVIYKRTDGSEINLKLSASRAVELEERLGAGITEKVRDLDRFSTAAEFIAAAIPDGEYKQRKETALAVYDEMTEKGQTVQDYQYLIFDILVSAGFLRGKAVTMQKELQETTQEKAEALLAENLKALQS